MKQIKYIFLIILALIVINNIVNDDTDYDTNSDSNTESIEMLENIPIPIWSCMEIQFSEEYYKKRSVYYVYVDDEKIGKVEVGKRKCFDLYLLTGKHEIYVTAIPF